MKKENMRLSYAIIGAVEGLATGIVYVKSVPENAIFSILIIVAIGVIAALIFEKNLKEDVNKEIVLLVIFVLTPVIAIIGKYLYAIITVLFNMVVGILKAIFKL